MQRRSSSILSALVVILALLPGTSHGASARWQFGFAKADITPSKPLRLSGYGNRTEPFTGIDESLWVRCMAIDHLPPTDSTAHHQQAGIHVLVSVDTIGMAGNLVDDIATQVERSYGLQRPHLAICFTHAHTAPHIAGTLTNLFSKPLTQDERAGTEQYTQQLLTQIVQCVGDAISDLAPGTLAFTQGTVSFAENRRVLREGQWSGFGVTPKGPVDHSLPLLTVRDDKGQVRGIVFNYACHCTTLGGAYNRVNGDWAGYAKQYLEKAYPGACALCTIGCGADANPPRDPERAVELAQAHGQEILQEVKRLTALPMQPITEPLVSTFGYAELAFDCPSEQELKQQLENARPQVRQHAQNMLKILERDGHLAASYRAPIQAWQFGDQLAMVFLSGEVVVDYALRLQRERAPQNTWVTAYANDLFAYLASERVRGEGGYEVDGSMTYYNQPGRWASGTEEVVMHKVQELLK